MIEKLRQQYSHMRWADERTRTSLKRATTTLKSATSERALSLYAHVLGAEHIWLSRLLEKAATVVVWPTLDLDACEMLAAENADGFDAFLAARSAEDLAHLTSYTTSAGQLHDSRVDDILLHVVMHGMYHRGQIALLLRDSGAEPNGTDYITFIRNAPAATTGATAARAATQTP